MSSQMNLTHVFEDLQFFFQNFRSGANMTGIKESLSKFPFIFNIAVITETWTNAEFYYYVSGYTLFFIDILHKDDRAI